MDLKFLRFLLSFRHRHVRVIGLWIVLSINLFLALSSIVELNGVGPFYGTVYVTLSALAWAYTTVSLNFKLEEASALRDRLSKYYEVDLTDIPSLFFLSVSPSLMARERALLGAGLMNSPLADYSTKSKVMYLLQR